VNIIIYRPPRVLNEEIEQNLLFSYKIWTPANCCLRPIQMPNFAVVEGAGFWGHDLGIHIFS